MTVIDWLLDSDPAIRWQVLRDLTDAPAHEAAAERAKVATEGWGAQVLALQGADGHWSPDDPNPDWVTFRALLLLRDMGLDPTSHEARRAVARVRDNVTWHGVLPQDAAWHGRPLFAGEVEPCINGRAVAIGSYFGEDVQGVVDRLLGEQMADGGWNCEQENGSTRGSFNTTINVLEGFLEHERATGGTTAVTAARERGQEYLLERRMLRRLSTGEVVDPAFTHFLFPSGWHYDVLRGLNYLRSTGILPDERVREAIDVVESRRDTDGRWPLENVHSKRPSSTWERARASRADGTPFALCGCCAGTRRVSTRGRGRSPRNQPGGLSPLRRPAFWLSRRCRRSRCRRSPI